VDPFTSTLIDVDLTQLIIVLFTGLACKLEHTRMLGDHHTETFKGHGLFHQVGQSILLIGVDLKYGIEAKALQNAPNGDNIRCAVEVTAAGGMVLMPCHGSGSVFHDDHGNIVAVVDCIYKTGQCGMEKGGITHKRHYFTGGVEQ
jgi:hypothetical protein